MRRSPSKLSPISGARVERRHAAASQPKTDSNSAIVAPAFAARVAATLRSLRAERFNTGCTTRLAKLIAEGSLAERMTIRADDGSKIAAGAGP
jgi:hypothetical protein